MAQFIQLTPEEIDYLLNLIADMDSDTVYTADIRILTIEKLMAIKKNPRASKLFYNEVTYLLELIEDDDLESASGVRIQTQNVLEDIQNLQAKRFQETLSIEEQRELRRAKRVARP